jgi:hypothetical protein
MAQTVDGTQKNAQAEEKPADRWYDVHRKIYPVVLAVPVTAELADGLEAAKKSARMPSMAALLRMILEDYVESIG